MGGTGRYRVQIPETESGIEIYVAEIVHPTVKRRLDWPTEGDLDLGRIVVTEDLGR